MLQPPVLNMLSRQTSFLTHPVHSAMTEILMLKHLLQVIVDSMVSLCRELCPSSSAAAERLSPSLSSVSERVSIPRSAIRTALMERAAQDIHRALEYAQDEEVGTGAISLAVNEWYWIALTFTNDFLLVSPVFSSPTLLQRSEALSGFLSHQLHCGPNPAGALHHP